MAKKAAGDAPLWSSALTLNAANGATAPVIPIHAVESLGAGLGHVGLISAGTSLASAAGAAAWGTASDRVAHRKWFVVGALAGTGTPLLLMAAAPDIWWFLLLNILLGVLSSAFGPIATVLLIEDKQKRAWGRSIGSFNMTGSAGYLLGLGVGGAWELSGNAFAGLFWAGGALALAGAAAAVLIREPEKKINRADIDKLHHPALNHRIIEKGRFLPSRMFHFFRLDHIRRLRDVHRVHLRHDLVVLYAATFLLFAGFLSFYAPFPLFLRSGLGASAGEVFAVMAASSTAATLLYRPAGRWAGADFGGGPLAIQFRAAAVRCAIFPLMVLLPMQVPSFHGAALLAAAAFNGLAGVSWAFISVTGLLLTSRLAPATAEGEAMGLYHTVSAGGAMAGALVGGVAAQYLGFLPAALLSALWIAGGLVMLGRIGR